MGLLHFYCDTLTLKSSIQIIQLSSFVSNVCSKHLLQMSKLTLHFSNHTRRHHLADQFMNKFGLGEISEQSSTTVCKPEKF